jgi:DHA1 family bicyclomycin/chloramphenicol resistance-like MFS transporter
MKTTVAPSFITLVLMISFASVNALLYTPALPNIAAFFEVSNEVAQNTVLWFLAAYALGQLIYGPFANRFGRKPTLYVGVIIQIISSFLCILAGYLHLYILLVLGRFLLALGSGVGLKMAFTIVSEYYEPQVASKKISYMMIAFAVTPGLGVALGGFLNEYFGWTSCFYAGALYGVLLLILFTRLPETKKILDTDALKFSHLLREYKIQFSNKQLVACGLLMGGASCFFYLFAAISPFVSIKLFGMSSSEFGTVSIFPPIGLLAGLLFATRLTEYQSFQATLKLGIIIACFGTLLMFVAMTLSFPLMVSLFLPMVIIYFGLSMVMSNGSIIAMNNVTDKAHGAAVMSFINIGLATLAVLIVGFIPVSTMLLPLIYVLLCVGMVLVCWGILMTKYEDPS